MTPRMRVLVTCRTSCSSEIRAVSTTRREAIFARSSLELTFTTKAASAPPPKKPWSSRAAEALLCPPLRDKKKEDKGHQESSPLECAWKLGMTRRVGARGGASESRRESPPPSTPAAAATPRRASFRSRESRPVGGCRSLLSARALATAKSSRLDRTSVASSGMTGGDVASVFTTSGLAMVESMNVGVRGSSSTMQCVDVSFKSSLCFLPETTSSSSLSSSRSSSRIWKFSSGRALGGAVSSAMAASLASCCRRRSLTTCSDSRDTRALGKTRTTESCFPPALSGTQLSPISSSES
mmetsp:Transcript_12347/g.40370  ORF Transcript_12347/g.40370 Transcript_12347/m.40370 type:complete len:296 (-) Transcript_12347:1876-2763(-)